MAGTTSLHFVHLQPGFDKPEMRIQGRDVFLESVALFYPLDRLVIFSAFYVVFVHPLLVIYRRGGPVHVVHQLSPTSNKSKHHHRLIAKKKTSQ